MPAIEHPAIQFACNCIGTGLAAADANPRNHMFRYVCIGNGYVIDHAEATE